ncbi:TolB family protein [Catenuloplanes nepalensis]
MCSTVSRRRTIAARACGRIGLTAALSFVALAALPAIAHARTALPATTGAQATAGAPATIATHAEAAAAHELVFVRDGNVLLLGGGAEKPLTTGGGAARPRWSPDGKRIAYLLKNRLWVMNADGTGRRDLGAHASGGADWSPDGKWLAFAAPGCTGGPVVYRVATSGEAKPEVLFPAECKGQPLPTEKPEPARGGTLSERIAVDDTVSWAPDGKRIAFRGGMCESIYDACLTIGTVAGAGERAVATFGGGGQQSGSASVPSWRPDGARLTWTAGGSTKLTVIEYDPATGGKRTLGKPGDRELSYRTARTAYLTGERDGRSWIFQLDPAGSTRTALRQGSQPDPRP